MSSDEVLLKKLSEIAYRSRVSCLQAIVKARSGHIGGSFSAIEMLVSLGYVTGLFEQKRHDHIILSKGHGCPAYYAILAEAGYVSRTEFENYYRRTGHPFKGHPDVDALSAVEFSSNSLGIGVGTAVGMTLAQRLKHQGGKTYVIVGDGEYREGLVQESLMFAAEQKLANLVVLIDNNRIQMSKKVDIPFFTPETFPLRFPLAHVQFCDGHSFPQLLRVLGNLQDDKLNVIVCHTIKGRGIRAYENNLRFHGSAPAAENLVQDLKELQLRQEENIYG